MDLDKVKKIIETTVAARANEYLENGWVLITTATNTGTNESAEIKYSLGWVNDGDPVDPFDPVEVKIKDKF